MNEYTSDQVRKFLDTYATTGSVAGAAKTAGIPPGTHYARLEADPGYRLAYEAAQRQVIRRLEDKAFERALAGSAELLIFLLRAWMPEHYSDNAVHQHSGSTEVPEEPQAMGRRMKEKLQ